MKYVLSQLYMPLTAKDKGISKTNPLYAYAKKRDAENHVALLTVRKMKDKGFFDDFLFPVPTHPGFKGCIGAQQQIKVAHPSVSKASMGVMNESQMSIAPSQSSS